MRTLRWLAVLQLGLSITALGAERTRALPHAWGDAHCSEPLSRADWKERTWRVERYRLNHLMQSGGELEVLIPKGGGSFELVKARNFSHAETLLSAIREPIDLEGLIASRIPARDELLGLLKPLERTEPDIKVTERTKELFSLKTKLFDKVRKKGASFRLDQIDDIVGARLAAPTREAAARLASRLYEIEGLKVEKFEPIAYDRGYRATHVTVRSTRGDVYEVQVMTHRMLAWVQWNAKRVYKSPLSRDSAAFQRLAAYDREIINYLNALDAGSTVLPPKPSAEKYRIPAEDVFPENQLE